MVLMFISTQYTYPLIVLQCRPQILEGEFSAAPEDNLLASTRKRSRRRADAANDRLVLQAHSMERGLRSEVSAIHNEV